MKYATGRNLESGSQQYGGEADALPGVTLTQSQQVLKLTATFEKLIGIGRSEVDQFRRTPASSRRGGHLAREDCVVRLMALSITTSEIRWSFWMATATAISTS
jgi:hypothetical protein